MASTVTKIDVVPSPMIFNLIGQAIGKIGAIGKDSEAKNFSGKLMYKFRGIDAVYNAINPVMAELGLFIIPEILDIKREERLSENNKTLIYSILTVRYTIYAPDGSSVQGTTVGEAMDTGDKSMNKAMSAALKYFIFQTFVIPTEEMRDPDAEVHDLAPRNENRPAQTAQAVPAQVSVANAIPKKVSNPVFEYIKNEQAFMAQRLGVNGLEMKVKFSEWRNELVKSNAVPDIPPFELSMDQAKELVEAIYATFMTDKGDQK